jgi:bla regulator protein blaR1
MPSFEIMENMREFLASAFDFAAYAATYAGLLAIIVAAINLIFRRWISATQMALLWGLVLVRLVLPVAPFSPLSIQYLLRAEMTGDSGISETYELADWPRPGERLAVDITPPKVALQTTTATEADPWINLLYFLLPFVWFIVGAAGLIWTMARHWRFCRRVDQLPPTSNERLLRLWCDCCKLAGVKKRIDVLLFDGVAQPAVMGLSHQTLLLPPDAANFDDDQLRMIMLHELAHVRRRDIAVNWALVIIRAIHWWNPIYWLAATRFRNLREKACDAFVVRKLENQSVHNYSELLLNLAARHPAAPRWRVMLPASILSFYPSVFRNRTIRGRIKSLRRACVEQTRWHGAAVAVLVLLAAIVGLTDARTPEPEAALSNAYGSTYTEPTLKPFNLSDYEVHEVYAGPFATRSYDIAKVLDRMTPDVKTRDAAKKNMEVALNQLFHTTNGTRAAVNESTSPRPTYTIHGNTLSADAPATLHDRIARLLAAWEECGLTEFAVTTRFISGKRDLASPSGIAWEYVEVVSSDQPHTLPAQHDHGMPVVHAAANAEEYLPIAVATLDEKKMAEFIDAAQADARTNVLNAPKIAFFNGEEVNIADCTERPFVVGFHDTNRDDQQPKIAVLTEGSRIKLHVTQKPDHKSLHLEAAFDFSSIDDVQTASINFHGKPATFQIPHVNRRLLDVASDIAIGRSLLIASIPASEKQNYFYVLLTTTRISDSTKEK